MHLYDLNEYGIISISGVDAKKLLQGQLTCNVENLTQATLGAQCKQNGRIISLFYIFHVNHHFYLLLPRSMLSIQLAALKTYAHFYKVDITISNEYVALGCVDELTLPHSYYAKILVNNSRYIFIYNISDIDNIRNTTTLFPYHQWKLLDIQHGIPMIYPETTQQFLPHEINLPHLHAVSFDKGCYTGQEIIARMHYRGKSKKSMRKAHLNTHLKLNAGSEIYANQDIFTIVDIAEEDYNHYYALILLNNEINTREKLLTQNNEIEINFLNNEII